MRNPIPKIPDGTTYPRIKTRVHPRIATKFGTRRWKEELAGPSNHGPSLGVGHLVRGLFVIPYNLLVRSRGPDG